MQTSTVTPQTSQRPLADFFEFVQDFRSIPALVAKMAWIAPLTDLALAIGPPWPSRVAVSTLVTLAEIATLMYAFEFWRGRGASIRQVRTRFKFAFWGSIALLAVYMWLYRSYVEDAPDRWNRVVVGYEFKTKDIGDRARTEGLSNRELLTAYKDRPDLIWTQQSVANMSYFILAIWLTMWMCVAFTVAAFVSLAWTRKQNAKPKKASVRPTRASPPS